MLKGIFTNARNVLMLIKLILARESKMKANKVMPKSDSSFTYSYCVTTNDSTRSRSRAGYIN